MKKTRSSKSHDKGFSSEGVFVLSEGEAPDWWFESRRRTLAAVRGRDIPSEIIDLVEDYRGDDSLPFHLASPSTAQGSPNTARDALAVHLDRHLALLGDGRGGRVRGQGMLARSDIAAVALLLLEEKLGAPSAFVTRLISHLLVGKDDRVEGRRRYAAWKAAASILAQDPEASVTDVAMQVGVVKGTISAWMREADFQTEIRRNQLNLDVVPGALDLYLTSKAQTSD